MTRTIIKIILLLLLLLASSPSSQAATITVGQEGSDFHRIEAALSSANPGDVIEVASGEYLVNLNITTPGIVLRGVDTGGGIPVLRAGMSTAEIERTYPGLTWMVQMTGGTAVAIRADFVTVENFVITGASSQKPYDTGEHNDVIGNAGIRVYSDFNKIANNTFEGNELTGIGLLNSSNNQILNNTIRDVRYGHGINLHNSHNNNIEGNDLLSNYNGIELQWCDSNTIQDNEIRESVIDGIRAFSCNFTFITYNIITRNGHESELGSNWNGISLVGSMNLVANNVISFNRNDGIYLNSIFWEYCSEPPCGAEESYENLIIGNRIEGNGRDGVHLSKTWKNNIIDNNITENHGKGINLEESSNNTIDLNNVTKNDHGIYLDRSNFTAVKNNTIAEGEKAGIYLWSTVGSSMDNNTLLDNPAGLVLAESSERNVLVRNNVTNSTEGINISGGSDENQIQQNRLRSCGIGVILAGAGRNVISANEIADSLLGISLDVYSRGNSILGNDLSTNVEAAKDEGDNRWDDGSRGNYYGTDLCDDADGDGICDGPRSIPGGWNVDVYPLARAATA